MNVMKNTMVTPKKGKDDSSSSNDKPQPLTETPKAAPHSALRLILRFEGSAESNDSTKQTPNSVSSQNSSGPQNAVIQATAQVQTTGQVQITGQIQTTGQTQATTQTQAGTQAPTSTPKKKSKKKKKDKDKKPPQPESMYIVLDASDSGGKDGAPAPANVKQETPAERERRLNVPLRQRHNRTPLQRLLDYAIQQLEDKDAMQVFAWPVTDQIAPGYSKVVKTPMDFSTMRQKINDNLYTNFQEFSADFQLMCNNAMSYNRPDTMYYKTAKRLLHSGIKFLSAEKFSQLAHSFPLIKQIPPEQLGFDWETGSPVEFHTNNVEENEKDSKDKDNNKKRGNELTAEEALELAKKSACSYDERQFLKRRKTTYNMGFLRQRQDGSTSLAIFVPNEGVDPERPGERVVTVGQMVGKLNQGTGQLQGFREHRRNIAKAVKPLTYGPFGSYAPSYDSTFANLSKEESDLVYGTYGEEIPPYIENVLSLAKVCDYTMTMVDNLLDVVTGGEHRKSKNVVEDQKKLQEEEERAKGLIEKMSSSSVNPTDSSTNTDLTNAKIEMEQLKTLSELGIDTSFLGRLENSEVPENESADPVQNALNNTSKLIEKLHNVQYERLSAPPPSHLSQISPPSEMEVQLAEKIVENLTTITKQVPPAAIIPIPAIRKAMGVVSDIIEGARRASVSSSAQSDPPPATPATESKKDSTILNEIDSDLRDIIENGSSNCTFEIQDSISVDEVMSEG